MSKKTWIIIILLLVGLFGYLILDSDKKDANNQTNTQAVADPKKVASDDHVTGSKENKIVLIEYLDFQCPACRNLYPTVMQARQKYGDKVTFVVRHFPLTSIHTNALAGSRAAEAASAQGKFFEMEEVLYTDQDSWAQLSSTNVQKKFEEYATQLGLNLPQFQKDFASSTTLDRINRDRSTGSSLGAQSTPTLLLNGEKITLNAQDDLDKALDKAVKGN